MSKKSDAILDDITLEVVDDKKVDDVAEVIKPQPVSNSNENKIIVKIDPATGKVISSGPTN